MIRLGFQKDHFDCKEKIEWSISQVSCPPHAFYLCWSFSLPYRCPGHSSRAAPRNLGKFMSSLRRTCNRTLLQGFYLWAQGGLECQPAGPQLWRSNCIYGNTWTWSCTYAHIPVLSHNNTHVHPAQACTHTHKDIHGPDMFAHTHKFSCIPAFIFAHSDAQTAEVAWMHVQIYTHLLQICSQ